MDGSDVLGETPEYRLRAGRSPAIPLWHSEPLHLPYLPDLEEADFEETAQLRTPVSYHTSYLIWLGTGGVEKDGGLDPAVDLDRSAVLLQTGRAPVSLSSGEPIHPGQRTGGISHLPAF